MFNERTHLHTNANLTRIIDGAARMGELDRLYWMVEIKIAAALAGTKQPVIAAASYPLGWVPVVPVGSDPKLSRHYAEILLECLKSANRGRLIDFGLALTSTDVIDGGGYQAYEWGELLWDCVCVECGAVWCSTGVGEEVCESCRGRGAQACDASMRSMRGEASKTRRRLARLACPNRDRGAGAACGHRRAGRECELERRWAAMRTAKTSNFAPGLAQKLDKLNEYELPPTVHMILPNETLGVEYHRIMIADLRDRAEQDDHAALWALETIANLYMLWEEATNKLSDIEEIIDRSRK